MATLELFRLQRPLKNSLYSRIRVARSAGEIREMNTWLLLALAGVADSALVVIVDGIPADQLTKRVVQHAVDDVIPIVEAPEQVIDVKFFPVPGYPSSVRIESTVRMGDPWRTCGEVGFRNAQDCHDGVDLPYDAPPSLAV